MIARTLLRRWLVSAAANAALATCAALGAASSASPARAATLSGHWVLNRDLTFRMTQALVESERDERGQGGRHGGGGRHHGFSGGGPGGEPGGGDGTGPLDPDDGRGADAGGGLPRGGGFHRDGSENRHGSTDFAAEVAVIASLAIVDGPNTFRVENAAGHAIELALNGRSRRDEEAIGGPVELAAKRDGGSVVVSVRPDHGPRRSETYTVENDGAHLYVTVELLGSGDRPPRKVRRAYDPETAMPAADAAPAASAAPPAAPPPS